MASPTKEELISSSSSTCQWSHDIFLSFRGEDTRYDFTDHLYTTLCNYGLNTFFDKNLERGEEISKELLKTIEMSMISIVVLSENYASSTWCLDELVKILECRKIGRIRKVYPIFYKVTPSEVRKNEGKFGIALDNYEKKFKDDMEKVKRWREALTEVANLSGHEHKNGEYESEFIKRIIEEISSIKPIHMKLPIAKYLVGVNYRVEAIESLLAMESNGVFMVGIHGLGGVGKTTISMAVYNRVVDRFEGSCFLENVREKSKTDAGIIQLQETLLSKVLQSRIVKVNSVCEGIIMIEERLCNKKVFLILDDVDQSKEIENLLGYCNWFALGSRVIVTTRDKHVLANLGRDAQIKIYEVPKLDPCEACVLFNMHAFGKNEPKQEYSNLAEHIISSADGLPLALKIMGSDLYNKSIDEWACASKKYKKIPHEKILDKLKISYYGLGEEEKDIFLDIACFFRGFYKDEVVNILDACELFPNLGIGKLIDKCLITIDRMGILCMHDLLQQMGREIVQRESKEFENRSRIWHYEDAYELLTKNMGSNKIRGIMWYSPKPRKVKLQANAFKNMRNLKFLLVGNVQISEGLKYLPNKLKQIHPYKSPGPDENQCAFVANRLITDNVLVAYEIMHYIKRKRDGNDSFMAAKLDMSKAFDRVEWTFIDKVMKRMGFNQSWIDLVMKCITSVTYSVIINGSVHGSIVPTRGLRQGDPLSPYLFLLCAEGFTALINEATRYQQLNGITICRGAPKISHLFFADDSLLFCKANRVECNKLMEILRIYESASGQKINTEKSSIFFSPNTSQEQKEEILNILGPMNDSRHTKYLGLPSIIGRSKKQIFAEIREKVGKKLAGWKGKLLSMGGKEILIKAVAQAIPSYAMSCFLLPKSLCEDLERDLRNFWWGQKQQEYKVAWVGWKKMCQPKSLGGLGFRNLHAFNLALLAKQVWRMFSSPSSLAARILKAKYFPFGDILNASLGSSPSYAWRSIFQSIEVIKSGTRWRVGNGRLIHIWDDKWLPTPSTFKIISPRRDFGDYPMVSSLIDRDTKWWKADVIKTLFLPFEADMILKIPLSQRLPEDSLIWIGNKRGVFTVKSAYHIAAKLQLEEDSGESSSGDSRKIIWEKLWKMKLPPKTKIFAWRACVNSLPVYVKMADRGIRSCCDCPVCGDNFESLFHALIQCDFALSVWALWNDCPLLFLLNASDFTDVVLHFCSSPNGELLEYFFATAWAIWHNRNQLVHNELGLSPLQIWDLARSIIQDFHEVNNKLSLAKFESNEGWLAPPPGYFKVNVDGASPLDDNGTSGVGAIVRNSEGKIVAALCKALPSIYPAAWTELFALEQGILLAQQMEISKVIFESDAALAVQAVSQGSCDGEIGHIVQGILEAKSSFLDCSFRHVNRDFNEAAHKLAQFAKWNSVSHVWKDDFPLFWNSFLFLH